MGYTKLKLPNGHFVFKGKPNAKGTRRLYLRYYLNGIEVLTSTDIALLPTDWDNRKELVKSVNPAHAILNSRLRKQREKVDNRIYAYNKQLTLPVLKKMLSDDYDTDNSNTADFFQYALDYNESCYNLEKIAYSTYSNDNYNIEKFREYISQTTGINVLPFDKITIDLFDKYKEHCLSIGNKKQSINKKLKPLYKTIDNASKNDLIMSKLAANIRCGYFDLKNRKYMSEIDDDNIHYLTTDQLQEFVDLYNKVKYDRTREFIDMFMFCFYACGLRFSDLLTLEWDHINWQTCAINKNLYKGNVSHKIPLTDAAIEILLDWERKKYNKRFVFDLLPEYFDLDDVAFLDRQRKSKNRVLQISLIELGKKLPTKLNFNLSIHTARHTFAVRALDEGISLHMLSQLLGHSSIAVTESAYAKFLPDKVKEEILSKCNYVFRPQN